MFVWQAFEPPLDLSQDLDICEQDPQNILDNSRETNNCSCGSVLANGCDEAICGEEGIVVFSSPKVIAIGAPSVAPAFIL